MLRDLGIEHLNARLPERFGIAAAVEIGRHDKVGRQGEQLLHIGTSQPADALDLFRLGRIIAIIGGPDERFAHAQGKEHLRHAWRERNDTHFAFGRDCCRDGRWGCRERRDFRRRRNATATASIAQTILRALLMKVPRNSPEMTRSAVVGPQNGRERNWRGFSLFGILPVWRATSSLRWTE